MRLLVVAFVALAVALPGCTKDPAAADDSPSSSSTGPGAAGNTTAKENHPPSASMKANATGQAPVNVTFEFNATDSDGDRLTWVLDFGDNTTANGTFQRVVVVDEQVRPAGIANATNVTHLYTSAGRYDATLRVSDGNATTNVTLELDIVGGTPFTQFVASGTPDLPCPQCSNAGANTGAGYRAGVNELDSYFVEIPADAAGQPFTATSTGGDPDMVFRDGCAGGAAVGDTFVAGGPEAGEVPEGAVCALMWETMEPGSTITLTIG
jgi:hypothetical protein